MKAADLAELALGDYPAVRLRGGSSGSIQKREAARIVAEVLATIRAEVWRLGRLDLPGFGVFVIRERAGKRVTAPDGSVSFTSAHRVVTFRPAKAWRTR